MTVNPIPEGYDRATPYLIVKNASEAIRFYQQAFEATELMRLTQPNGSLGHAEIKVGNAPLMLADESPEMGIRGPQTIGGTAVTLCLYVQDVDAVFARAIALGAKEVRPVTDQFYGDRAGMLEDPYGHVWNIATHIEDVSQEELQKRFEAQF